MPSAKSQVQVERPQAKPRTYDLEVWRATAILGDEDGPGSQNSPALTDSKITNWGQNWPEGGANTHPKSQAGIDGGSHPAIFRSLTPLAVPLLFKPRH